MVCVSNRTDLCDQALYCRVKSVFGCWKARGFNNAHAVCGSHKIEIRKVFQKLFSVSQ